MGTARRVSLRNERGAVLVYVALALVFALLGMVALAIDMGYMYVAKAQLQNAADAGALAGASKLTGQFSNISAHYKAQQFAQKNHAAGETVKVDANLGNAPGGDTVVGCWDGAFHETPVANCTRANAIKVVARRTSQTGAGISADNKPVNLFFEGIFNRRNMPALAEAIACRPPKPSGPIVLCQELCSKTPPFNVYFNQNLAIDPSGQPDPAYTVGWTEFSADSKATDLGPNSDVAKLIDGRKEIPMGLCGLTLWTNNGLGNTIKVLHDTFESKKNPITGTWTILVPIFEFCPSSISSAESFTTLLQFAEITISHVEQQGGGGSSGGSSEPYVTITSINCESCATTSFLGNKILLAK